MGLGHLSFLRDWTNPADFPTVEPDEATVRADLQYHPDAIKNYINETLIPSHDSLTYAKHSHGNKTVLDGITADDVAKWRGTIGTFRITVTSSNRVYSADKTFDEIKAAYDAGQLLYVVDDTLLNDNTIYTLDLLLYDESSAQGFADFRRHLTSKDKVQTETLRIYSHTLASGSNIELQTERFNVPRNSYVLLVTGTESTESDIPLTSEQVTALQNAAQNNSPITMILRDGDSYAAYYPIVVGNTSMVFGKVNNFNSVDGGVDVNQALGRIVIALVQIQNGAGTLSFAELPSGLTRFLPCSISITWTEEANSYTLTDAEYAILRQSLLDKRPIFIVRNTADVGGTQTLYTLKTCDTPSIRNVDSMTLILQGASDSIKIQMADKLIVPNSVETRAPRVFYFADDTVNTTTQYMTAEDSAALKAALVDHTPVMLIAKTQGQQYCYLPVNLSPVPTADNINDPNTEFSYTFQTADNVYRAYVSCSGAGTPSIAVFQTIS